VFSLRGLWGNNNVPRVKRGVGTEKIGKHWLIGCLKMSEILNKLSVWYYVMCKASFWREKYCKW